MFEGMKGIKKGGKVAEAVSESTMQTINWLINNGHNLKTNDTLFTCSEFFCYAKLICFPTNMSQSKFIKYTGSIDVQAKTLLNDWLKNATGVFTLDEYFDSLDNEFQKFTKKIMDNNDIPDGDMNQKFSIIKTHASFQIISDFSDYFELDTDEFKKSIGNYCEQIRHKIN